MSRLQERLRSSVLTVTPLDTDGIGINGLHIVGLNTASFKKLKNYERLCPAQPGPSTPRTSHRACPRAQMESLRSNRAARLLLFTHVPDLRDSFRKTPAWEIEPEVRHIWEAEACKPRVIAIFAGHFHDFNRALYGGMAGTRDLALAKCVADKTWVAPPLAIKNQLDKPTRARGFMLATVTLNTVTRADVSCFPDTAVKSVGGSIPIRMLLEVL